MRPLLASLALAVTATAIAAPASAQAVRGLTNLTPFSQSIGSSDQRIQAYTNRVRRFNRADTFRYSQPTDAAGNRGDHERIANATERRFTVRR